MSTAARVGSINVVLNTTFGSAVRGLNVFADHVERTGMKTRQQVAGIDASVIGMNRTLARIGSGTGFRSLAVSALQTRDSIRQMNGMLLATSALLGGLIPTLSGAYLVRMADRAQLLGNELRTVTKNTEELKAVEQELFNISQKTRSSFEAATVIYARTARATEAFGLSQQKLLRITETINKAFISGRANPAEAKGAAIQLTQGIASDRFSGEEFRSVAENAPVLLQGMANSLGVTIGRLREMAHAGELTAKIVTEAILNSGDEIDARFAKTQSTIEQAVVRLDNAILKYVSDSENASVASGGIVTIINALAENLDTVTDSLLLLGGTLITAFAGRKISNIYNAVRATSELTKANREATAAALKKAQAEAAAASQQARSSAAYLASLNKGRASESALAKARKQNGLNLKAVSQAQAALTIATERHAMSLRAAATSTRVMTVATRAFAGVLSFLGGPVGASLLAFSAAMYVTQKRSMEAKERLDRYASTIRDLADDSERSAEDIRKVAAALKDVSNFASQATLRVELQQASEDMATFVRELASMDAALARSGDRTRIKLKSLGNQLVTNKTTLEEFLKKTDKLSASNPGLSKMIKATQELGQLFKAAEARVKALQERLQELDGQNEKVTIEVNQLTAAQKAALNGQLEDVKKRFREDKIKSIKEMIKAGEPVDDVVLRMFPKVQESFDNRPLTDAEKAAKKFGKTLDGLDFRLATSGLSDLDREVARTARSAGIAEGEIRKFIAAAKSGGEATGQIAKIKNRLQEISDIQFRKSLDGLSETNVLMFLSDLDREVVDTARSFGVAEDEVRAFIAAASSEDFSQISERMRRVREEVTAISENERIKKAVDDISSAFGGFLKNALLGTDSLSDAFGNLVTRLAEVYLEMLLIEPLMESIRGGGPSGGGLFGALKSIWVPTQHTGGQAGVSNTRRPVSLGDVMSAQKFHSGKSGVGHNEVMALLEKSESVYTADQNRRIASGLTRGVESGKSIVQIRLDDGLIGQILAESREQALQLAQDVVSTYNKKVMPGEAMKAVQKQYGDGKSFT